MRILITGSAGFIGHHLVQALRVRFPEALILGLDNLDPSLNLQMKRARLTRQGVGEPQDLPWKEPFSVSQGIKFVRADLADKNYLEVLFQEFRFDFVVHLAAQAGIRRSLVEPESYIQSNIVGFSHLLEACRQHSVKHLVFASSSSVYGTQSELPFKEDDRADTPISIYAATKRAGELLAYSYSHLFQMPATGLRFFTVYGPWGRPDMAYFKFAESIREGRTIDVFNHGKMWRDFTYIDDLIEGLLRVLFQRIPQSQPPYEIYNVGSHSPISLEELIVGLERRLGRSVERRYQPISPGEAPSTFADVDRLWNAIAFRPQTSMETGLDEFVRWFQEYTQSDRVCL